MLVGCLRALSAQTLPPLEVFVCYRDGDGQTERALLSLGEKELSLVHRMVLGSSDNFAAGLRAGIAASSGDLVALTDDDSEAPPDWLERITGYFRDASVAGVGGRDVLPSETVLAEVVGRIQWFGRRIGNHHAGVGGMRDVDFLKGVNCCFRGDLLREIGVDRRLKGSGTVIHTELSICLPMRRSGWRLIYDPQLSVTHHIAQRQDGDNNHRGEFNTSGFGDTTHNETLMVLEHLSPLGRIAFACWSFLIGTAFTPGLLHCLRSVATGGEPATQAVRRWWATRSGRFAGLRTYLLLPRPTQLVAKRRP
ncbi:Glycosyl transferase family 2 [Planctomycetes bacterium K2D]|uniref:Glycosyl transferase family 2 n=2 Tax=Botrimarina mediterranea TaxID=2528022 RepID=A0A518KA47_9BACT|nr:Glycosyl transferase family 2 [Botrimarina mediterranea]QDV79311.1 Glycosyl transferase family 2 [Planctomycetes bacterium K2D]